MSPEMVEPEVQSAAVMIINSIPIYESNGSLASWLRLGQSDIKNKSTLGNSATV